MSQHYQTAFTRHFLFFFFTMILLLSCSEEEPNTAPIFYANDFSLNVVENPSVGQEVGKIVARSNTGALEFKVVEELPIGALHVDVNTGEITVKDPAKFDWEVYRSVMVRVDVSNGTTSKRILISIQILDALEQDNYLIKQMIEKGFDSRGDLAYEIETNYTMGKMTSRYHNAGQRKTEMFSYNDQGLMSEQVIFKDGVKHETMTINYDDTFRITSIHHDYDDFQIDWTEVYSYPNDFEIIALQTSDHGPGLERKFVLKDGMVIEEWVDAYNPLIKAEYQDENIHYKFDQVSDVYYSYEEKGTNPHRYYEKMFASVPANIVLYHEGLDSATNFFTEGLFKEVLYQNDVPFKLLFEYELNEVDLAVYSKETLEEEGVTRLLKETFYEFEKRSKEGGLITQTNIP